MVLVLIELYLERMKRLVTGFALGFALAALVRAQGPPPFLGQEAHQTEPRMVDLNIVALDSHNQPVTDLTRDELRIVDANKPQTIVFFRHRDETLAAPPALAPNEVSNRGRGNVPRATMILFDMLNERFGTRGTSASRLVHDLQSLESGDYLYLYLVTLDGKLVAIHGLPGPEGEEPSPNGVPWTKNAKALLDRAFRSYTQMRPVDDLDPTWRIQLTFNVLDAAAAELSRAPGRKNLVWLTDGVPFELGPNRSDTGEFVDFTPWIRDLSETFDRNGVSIYPARQVMMGSPDSMGGPGASGLGSMETLQQFAELTGGRADAGKDIGAAVRQAITDARTSYQVGYYPPEGNWDDKSHKLKITCTRKGVKIQAKTAYYAWHEPAGARAEQAIDSMMKTTFDAAEIGLRATLTASPGHPQMRRLSVKIDARDVALVHEGDAYNGELRFAIIGYDAQGQSRRGPITPLDFHFTQLTRDKAMADGIPLSQDLGLTPEIAKVRLAVFDRASHAVGSVTIPCGR